MTGEIQPGLLVLHGNRAELLGEAVFAWLRRHPLQPLEEEVFLVQSNGMAEWLKMALATQAGVCAATRVELPARFLWRAYRQVLGRAAVPAVSPLDKLPLTWRLMQPCRKWWPSRASNPWPDSCSAGAWTAGCSWRSAWPTSTTSTRSTAATGWPPGPPGWTCCLPWKARRPHRPPSCRPTSAGSPCCGALLAPLSPAQQAGTRARLHQRFVAALQEDAGAVPPDVAPLPRRVVLFGMTHVPMQTLQALAALARHSQVLLAVPNPCRYHWADIIDGRELLRQQRRRHPLRTGRTWPSCRWRTCTPTPTPCWPPGAARGATSCASSMPLTTPSRSSASPCRGGPV
jgi:exodeoxyribonuclease V gamma subunit